jgi:hypothetical protein
MTQFFDREFSILGREILLFPKLELIDLFILGDPLFKESLIFFEIFSFLN